MNQNKKYILILVIAAVLILIDYSYIIYHKIFSEPGNWPNFYNYKISGRDLKRRLESLENKNLKVSFVPDTTSHHWLATFFIKDSEKYIHTWILMDPLNSKDHTQIVYGCIGYSKDPFSCERINVDYDLISNFAETKYFEDLVIDKINLKVDKR